MYFFKYFKPGLLEKNMLRRGEVFFASRSELNDANEFQCRFILKGSLDHWLRLADFLLAKVSWELEENYNAPKEVAKTLQSFADQLGRSLKKKSGTRDIPFELLGTYAADAVEQSIVKSCGDKKSHLILSVLRSFCDKQLYVYLHSPRYVTSFSLDGANPTMWGHYSGAGVTKGGVTKGVRSHKRCQGVTKGGVTKGVRNRFH